MSVSASFRIYISGNRASAVEFVLIFPFVFMMILLAVDAGNYFADRRAANRIAESIVRTARDLDNNLANYDSVALSEDTLKLLTNIAKRVPTQLPSERNYVWLGRYVRPFGPERNVLVPVRQLLPNGLMGENNTGLQVFGKPEDVVGVDQEVRAVIDAFAQPGELIYAVEVGFSRRFMTPMPGWMKLRLSRVRYIL